jgi:uncharacterized protein
MTASYWPWWASALALSAIAVGYFRALGSVMGVSGTMGRALRYREERAAEQAEHAIPSDAEMVAALAEATREAFGEAQGGATFAPVNTMGDAALVRRRLPIAGEVMFLAMLVVGAFIAATLRGTFAVRFDMGDDFARLVGTGARGLVALFVGGLLVGFGTRLAGGCTSGHGLAGCARLQRGSLIATACFFGTAALVSLAMGRL